MDRPESAPALTQSASPRLPVLDGLRTWVVLIMLAHFGNFDHPGSNWLQKGFLLLAQFAFVGLDMFFVLSGFLITRILMETKGSASYFRTFYARRMLRIFPVYYGTLILVLLVIPRVVSWDAQDLQVTPIQHLLYWTYLENWLVVGPWVPTEPTVLLHSVFHFWSLAVEEQFYLLWPAVVFLCSRHTLKKVCIGCVIASPLIRIGLVITHGVDSPMAFCLTPARLDGLAIGGLIAIVAAEPLGLAKYVRWIRRVGAVAFLVLFAILASQSEHDTANVAFQTVGLAASVYLAAAIVVSSLMMRPGRFWYGVLDSRPFRRVGQSSYAIYALHMPIAFLLGRWGLVTRGWFHGAIASNFAAELAYSGTMILLCIAAGLLSWHFFEQPILKLRRFFPYARPRAEPPLHLRPALDA